MGLEDDDGAYIRRAVLRTKRCKTHSASGYLPSLPSRNEYLINSKRKLRALNPKDCRA